MSEPCQYHAKLEAKIDRILVAVEGDEAVGHRGLARRMDAVEREQHNRSWWKDVWGALAVGAAALVMFFKR